MYSTSFHIHLYSKESLISEPLLSLLLITVVHIFSLLPDKLLRKGFGIAVLLVHQQLCTDLCPTRSTSILRQSLFSASIVTRLAPTISPLFNILRAALLKSYLRFSVTLFIFHLIFGITLSYWLLVWQQRSEGV